MPELIWFISGFILLLAEILIPAFIALFFGIGAWMTAIAVLIGIAPTTNIQLMIFIVTSLMCIVLFRNKSKQLLKNHKFSKGIEANQIGSVIGSHAVVIKDIIPNTLTGKVELFGTQWQAISDILIVEGTTVEVIEQNNLTLKVKALI